MIISCERCEVPFLRSACFNLNYDGAQASNCENEGTHFQALLEMNIYIRKYSGDRRARGWCLETSSFSPSPAAALSPSRESASAEGTDSSSR